MVKLKETLAALLLPYLRFETETLSEYQKNEILESAIGYYRGDLLLSILKLPLFMMMNMKKFSIFLNLPICSSLNYNILTAY